MENIPILPSILVVDSNANWQQKICETLRKDGHKPYPASTYTEVDQILAQQAFDIAIINPTLETETVFNSNDLWMLRAIRRQNPNIQTIFVTMSLQPADRETIFATYPATTILSKQRWDQNHFIGLFRAMAGEGPNTDDKRLRSLLVRSQYGTRPLTPPTAVHSLGHPRVLCIEGRQDWQQIFIEFFNVEQYYWRLVVSDDQACRMLENESFHLVILNDHDLSIQNNHLTSPVLDYLLEFRPRTNILVLNNGKFANKLTQYVSHYPAIDIIQKPDIDLDIIKHAITRATQVPQLKIKTFGHLRIWRNNKLVGHWQLSWAERLIKLLLTRQVNGSQAVSAQEIVYLLWDKPTADDFKKLRPLINEARLILEPNIDPRKSSFILRSSTGYSFDVGGDIDWDILAYRTLQKQGAYYLDIQQWDKALVTLEAARGLYSAEYLADEQTAWVQEVRRQLRKEYITVLTNLADVYAAHGHYTEGIRACSETLVNDPLVESVYRRLMRFYYWQGQKEEALKTYRVCVKLFEDLFGESPKPITRNLYQAIVRDEEVINVLLTE